MNWSMRGIGLGLLCLSATMLQAQSEEDALNLSTIGLGGTSRSNALAGAFGAVGADPASVSINPGGFGLCTTSSFSFTSLLEVNQVDALHYNTRRSTSQERFAVNNIALIIHTPAKDNSEWLSGTWGVTYDRLSSRHWTTVAVGERVPSTILTAFVNQAEGVPFDTIVDILPFTAGPAWDAYGIDTVQGSSTSYVGFVPVGADVLQRHVVESHGTTSRTAFFYSGNYQDRLYLGMSLGIVGQRLKRVTTHSEHTIDTSLDLQDLTYREELATNGNGFDVNVGAVVRVTDRIRTGLAFQSPQWLLLNDAWFTDFSTTFRTPDSNGNYSYESSSPDGAFSYRLRTPWRLTASGAYLAGKNGLVSVDYEFSDLRTMHFREANDLEDAYDFEIENKAIHDRFRPRHSLRIGTEWRAGNWYFRGGWGFVQDPYADGDPAQGVAMRTYAAGLGYRSKHLTVDLAFNANTQKARFFQYDPSLIDATIADRKSYSSFITFGFRP